nr:uncharacterized protein LOC129261818 [Lytechinus pictus]
MVMIKRECKEEEEAEEGISCDEYKEFKSRCGGNTSLKQEAEVKSSNSMQSSSLGQLGNVQPQVKEEVESVAFNSLQATTTSVTETVLSVGEDSKRHGGQCRTWNSLRYPDRGPQTSFTIKQEVDEEAFPASDQSTDERVPLPPGCHIKEEASSGILHEMSSENHVQSNQHIKQEVENDLTFSSVTIKLILKEEEPTMPTSANEDSITHPPSFQFTMKTEPENEQKETDIPQKQEVGITDEEQGLGEHSVLISCEGKSHGNLPFKSIVKIL